MPQIPGERQNDGPHHPPHQRTHLDYSAQASWLSTQLRLASGRRARLHSRGIVVLEVDVKIAGINKIV